MMDAFKDLATAKSLLNSLNDSQKKQLNSLLSGGLSSFLTKQGVPAPIVATMAMNDVPIGEKLMALGSYVYMNKDALVAKIATGGKGINPTNDDGWRVIVCPHCNQLFRRNINHGSSN
jgi:hypothetical protein